MSPSSPNPVSASSKKLSRSRSSTAQGSAGSTAEGGAAASAAGAGSAATAAAAVEGRLGLLDGVATAGLAGPPHEQDHPAAVRSFSSFYFSSRRREGRRSSCAVERRSEKGRGRKEEIRPLWYRARLDLAAAAAVPASASECSLPLSGRSFSCRRGGSSRPSSSSSSAVLDCSCACCKQRRRRLSSSFAERGACYGVLGEPQ